MIEKRTVFILGAGAHCSYGFPSGEQLKTEVADTVLKSVASDDNNMVHIYHGKLATLENVSNEKCHEFADALHGSGQGSIDSFLNSNRHMSGFEIIGKAGIAQTLMQYEKKVFEKYDRNREIVTEDDWLGYLFRLMADGVNSAEEFVERNSVGFVTFNYDRFLVWWFYQKLKSSYGLSPADAMRFTNRIPIHHVYGTLGPFPLSPSSDPRVWIEATQSIRTIFDALHDHSTVDNALSLLHNADALCLLGFGFHAENIKILNLLDHVRRCESAIFTSRYGLTEVEFQRQCRPLGASRMRNSSLHHQCLETLRNAVIF